MNVWSPDVSAGDGRGARRRNSGVNSETCEGCASSCCYIGKQPWLIPFSPGSPLCQPAGEIDLWVKRAFFFLFLVQGGGGGVVLEEVGDGYLLNWWRGDLMIHWQVQWLTHTHTQLETQHKLLCNVREFFSSCCCCCWGNLGRRRRPPFSFLLLWLTKRLSARTKRRSVLSARVFLTCARCHFTASCFVIPFILRLSEFVVPPPSCRGMCVIAVSFLT